MMRTIRWSGGLLVALAAIGSCAKDKTTALDIKLEITGALDQIRVDSVSLDGSPVSLTGEMTTLFPAPPRILKTGDVLTVWFADSEDTKMVVVTATGRLCGRDASMQATTPAHALAKGQTVPTTLTLANNGTVCTSTGTGGAGGGAGTGGTAGAGGTGAGTAGTGGAAGTGGSAGGSVGTGGSASGAAGTMGSGGTGGGAAGRGGTTGSAGTSGAAGRGGTTGSAGTGGAAGRGGTTGSAGTGGAAGRGGTTGTGGAAGRGGTTGSGGTGMPCATAPIPGVAQSIQSFSQTAGCGYTGGFQTVDFVAAPNDYFAYGSGVVFGNSANCGRCVELVRNSTPAKRVTVTLVGSCTDPVCAANPNQARFQVSASAYQLLAPMNETSLPLAGEMLTYSFVPCLVNSNEQILANIKISGGAAAAVLFVQQRYGIAAVTVENVTTAQQYPMARSNDAYWYPPTGMTLPPSARFRLTDVNNAMVTSAVLTTANTPAFASANTQFPMCP